VSYVSFVYLCKLKLDSLYIYINICIFVPDHVYGWRIHATNLAENLLNGIDVYIKWSWLTMNLEDRLWYCRYKPLDSSECCYNLNYFNGYIVIFELYDIIIYRSRRRVIGTAKDPVHVNHFDTAAQIIGSSVRSICCQREIKSWAKIAIDLFYNFYVRKSTFGLVFLVDANRYKSAGF